jgi:hypothetical protein
MHIADLRHQDTHSTVVVGNQGPQVGRKVAVADHATSEEPGGVVFLAIAVAQPGKLLAAPAVSYLELHGIEGFMALVFPEPLSYR